MITIEQLEEEKQKLEKSSEPFLEKLNKAKYEYSRVCDELSKPFNEMLDKYYDQKLIDKKGTPIRKYDIISDGKQNYFVKERGMQFVFGKMLNNPQVIIRRVNDEGQTVSNARDKTVHSSGLIEFEKITRF